MSGVRRKCAEIGRRALGRLKTEELKLSKYSGIKTTNHVSDIHFIDVSAFKEKIYIGIPLFNVVVEPVRLMFVIRPTYSFIFTLVRLYF